ncbi:MAG: substrate-binding domain-containing protein, partial [Pseudonocardiales bacterium]
SAVTELLNRDPELTAIVCTSDILALGALAEIRQRGLRVPDELTVTGFDGVPEAERAGLTTVSQPVLEKGRAAGQLLLDRSSPDARTIMLPTELVVRATCGPTKEPDDRWFSGL